jgi:hypothetical protein
MSGAIPPLPQYAFMAWCLVKKRRSTGTTLPYYYYYYHHHHPTIFFREKGEYGSNYSWNFNQQPVGHITSEKRAWSSGRGDGKAVSPLE